MDISTSLVLIAVLIMAAAYVIQPFVTGRGGSASGRSGPHAETLRQRAHLLADRNQTYATLRDLDFDYHTGKVADEDYAHQRKALLARGVMILQKLDNLPTIDESPQADPIEATVLEIRGLAGRKPEKSKRRR